MQSHKDLIVWQKAIDLAEEVYSVTAQLPRNELYGLSSQMQRSAISVPSNIAEGAKRNHKAEYILFLGIANGSAAELETQIILVERLYKDLNIDFKRIFELNQEILKMLNVMISKLKITTTYNL